MHVRSREQGLAPGEEGNSARQVRKLRLRFLPAWARRAGGGAQRGPAGGASWGPNSGR